MVNNIKKGDILFVPIGFSYALKQVFEDEKGLYYWDSTSKRYWDFSTSEHWDNSAKKEFGIRTLNQFLKERFDKLYEECKHGDKEHQLWLKNKIEDFYNKEIRDL